ncbi:MAG: 23S rRNA (pseudouridine(1915)-N(3))-methyltransferase RlmH, partial [Verrucomicrobiales bacterium]
MRIQLLVAGKPSLSYARSGVSEYLKRLGRYGNYELIHLKAGDSETVSKNLLERSEGTYRIALDERGETLNTADW